MKKTIIYVAVMLAIIISSIGPIQAKAAPDGTALIWLVHGVNGRDKSSDFMQYPVDISIDAVGCVRSNMMFMGTSGPIAIPSGPHTISVSPANPSPCSQAAFAGVPFNFEAGQAYSVVFHLDSAGNRVVSVILMDLTHNTSYNGKSRFTVMNAAYSPPVDLFIRLKKTNRTQTTKIANDMYKTQYIVYMGRSGSWKWWFTDASGANYILAPVLWNTQTHYAYFVFLVGSAANGYYTASFSVKTNP
jgi:hypothetical protein